MLSVQTRDGPLVVTAIAAGALRVSSGVEEPSPVLINAARIDAKVADGKISAGRIRAEFDETSHLLRFYNGEKLLLEESGRSIQSSTIHGQATLCAEVSFESPQDEHLYGSGQFQDGYLNIRDLPRRLTQVNTQIALPFVMSSRGYGVLWHNLGLTDLNPTEEEVQLRAEGIGATLTEEVTTSSGTETVTRVEQTFTGEFSAEAGRYALMLDIGQSMAESWQVTIDDEVVLDFRNKWLPPTTSWFAELSGGVHRVRVKGLTEDAPRVSWRRAASKTVFRSPVSKGIDYIIFAGNADEVIASYRQLTGAASLLPLWAYGFIQCRERYTSSEDLISTAREFRDRKLPLDVIVQDWMYWGKYGWNAMQWDEEFYPDPVELVEKLHAMHVRLMVSVWSKVEPKCEVGEELTKKNLYIPGTQWVDFFNPEARKVYWKNFSRRMVYLGIDAWWMDATEPENDALAGAQTHAGPGDLFRLLYPLLVNQTIFEGLRSESNKRVFILTRSAFLGQQRYGSVTWSGDVGNDWNTLRRQITGGLSQSICGLPYWTTDTGGFFRPPSQYSDIAYHERYIRWLQFSTFCPLMRVHGYQTQTEPWFYGEEVVRIQREYQELRYRLLPYIYSVAARVTLHGYTLMRPFVMDFASDFKALDQKYQYMFGPAFLVAPVVQTATTWDVYAPSTRGDWYNWWTEEPVSGRATVNAPLSQIPLLVRAGSIIPLAPVKQYAEASNSLEIRVYPGANAVFDLYEDSGMDYDYERGEYSTIHLAWDDAPRTFTVGARKGHYGEAGLSLDIRVVGGATKSVEYVGKEITVGYD